MSNMIKIAVGEERFKTRNPALARQVLEQATGLAQVVRESATSFAPPGIGEAWHGEGGIYAGLVRGSNGLPDYHLIVPTDAAGHLEEITWGTAGEDEPNATNARDGQANTLALVNSTHEHPAAQWARELAIDGHRDWYLPARHELRLCYLNAPEQFSTAGWYWSSTQCSPNNAWIQDFADGSQNGDPKGYDHRAVAVRRVVSPSAI